MVAKVLSGGEALERRLRERGALVKKAARVRVGFLENAKYDDGTPVAMIAAIQDFGAPSVGIPPRPFFRNMIAANKAGWPNALAVQLQKSNYDAAIALGRVGELIAGQLRESITEGEYAPLKPATIARKRFAKPLVDTGHMLNSVASEVEE